LYLAAVGLGQRAITGVIKPATTTVSKRANKIRWLRLALVLSGFVILSFGLAYLLRNLMAEFHFPLYRFAWLAYLIVFGTSLVTSLTIIAPVPFAASIMIAAATKWNPVLIALFGSIGGTFGELSGYYAGYLGRKIAIPESMIGYRRVERWIHRYGMWAILLLALQPIIPFDVGGLVAGAAKMPLRKFLLALWLGKFPKCVILIYAGVGLIHFVPFLSQ
jgi:uncharacterized membrane protein YdjX (TVP38/TMEM64 family)